MKTKPLALTVAVLSALASPLWAAPLVVTCPTNVTVWTCGTNPVVVVFPAPVTTGGCSTNLTTTCMPPSGSRLSPGLSTVICTTRDGCVSQRCNFTISVRRDTNAPNITCGGDITVGCGTTWTFPPPTAIDDGSGTNVTITAVSTVTNAQCGNTFTVTRRWRATDVCGNSATCAQRVTVIDTTPPLIRCPTNPISVTATTPAGAPVTFAMGATDACDPFPIVRCTWANGTLPFLAGSTVLPPGNHAIQCDAVDACGNSNRCFVNVTVRPPTNCIAIRCPSNIVVHCLGPAGTPATFAADATNQCGGMATVTCEPVSGSRFPVGPNPVICTATDDGDQTSQCVFVVEVVDDVAPAIVCPTNIVVQAETEEGALVSWRVVATDNCDTNIKIMCLPTSGSVFRVGTNLVGCVATDRGGNATSCNFRVTVLPPSPLVVQVDRSRTNDLAILRWTGPRVLQEAATLTQQRWRDSTAAVAVEEQTNTASVRIEGLAKFFKLRAAVPLQRKLVPWETYNSWKRVITTNDLGSTFKNRINLKMAAGTGIRSRNGILVIDPSAVRGPRPDSELERLNRLFAPFSRHAAVRMFFLPEATLTARKEFGEQHTGTEVPDLNLWFYIYVQTTNDASVVTLVNSLNLSPIVEFAYPSPLPTYPGQDDAGWLSFLEFIRSSTILPFPTASEIHSREIGWLPPSSGPASRPIHRSLPTPPPPAPLAPDLEPKQDYLVSVRYNFDSIRADYYNAYGPNTGYTDVEYAWNQSHEDLSKIASAAAVLVNGFPAKNTLDNRNHGTAVIGELSSDYDTDNFVNLGGTVGIVPNADVRLSTEWPATGHDRAAAITASAVQFDRGAVIILEMQTYAKFDANGDGIIGISNPNTGNTALDLQIIHNDLVPAEFEPAVKAAVKEATANGRIVVAAAGNGNVLLDHPLFGGKFLPHVVWDPADAGSLVDSGAIIVGANSSTQKDFKNCSSSWGSRIDNYAEGQHLTSTGYGDLFKTGGEDHFYTETFGGTSGATPIVAGSVLALSGILRGYHGSVFAPKEIREFLRSPRSHIGFFPPDLSGTPPGCDLLVFSGRQLPDAAFTVEKIHMRHLQMQSCDFDGDGAADYAVWSEGSFGNMDWFIRFSSDGSIHERNAFGIKGDIPCPANMVGDKRADLVFFRPSDGTWHIEDLGGNGPSARTVIQFGENGDIPVPLHYDAPNGRAQPAVFRSVNSPSFPQSQWRIATVAEGTKIIQQGLPGDTPLAADFDGDKIDDLAMFYEGSWNVLESTGQYLLGLPLPVFGEAGDIPLTFKTAGLWNLAVWRPSTGMLFQLNYSNPSSGIDFVQYGVAGDLPRFADTDGDSSDEFIIFRPTSLLPWFNFKFGVVPWLMPSTWPTPADVNAYPLAK